MASSSAIMNGQPPANIAASTIESIDAAFLKYVEDLNIFCNTSSGFKKIPVIWSSAERSFQIKNNQELRDANGSLIPPIISLERSSVIKDPRNKGGFQGTLSPSNDRYFTTRILNQEKTSEFANADSQKKNGQLNFVTSKKNKKVVYEHLSIPVPIYVTVEYKIHILTNYQGQMNEAIQPFMARTAQNYFIITNDSHKYECFMDPDFSQETITDLAEEERKYESTITIKVLGYLIGEGVNQQKPQVLKKENAVELKIPRERIIVPNENEKKIKEISNQPSGGSAGAGVGGGLRKRAFIIDNTDQFLFTLQHNFNTRDLYVLVREDFDDHSLVQPAINFISLNEIEVDMGAVDGQKYSVTVMG